MTTRLLLAPVALALVLAACGDGSNSASTAQRAPQAKELPQAQQVPPAGEAAQANETPPSGLTEPQRPQSLEGLQGALSGTGHRLPQADSGYAVDVSQREAVRLFYKTVFASSAGVASGWTGSISGCNAGDTSADYKAATLRRVNWFRAMAGVPASVQLDAVFNQKAQQAALVMAANNQLSHTPPSSWACYTAVAAEAASKSNLALGRAGADSVAEGYMRDSGANNPAVGHRRWLLFPQTQFMGTGDVDASPRTNALWVFDANIFGARPAVRDDFVAWPPPGYVPYNAVYPRWSVSYPQADFSAATVAMTENGQTIATRTEVLANTNGAGENTLVWFPGSYADGADWARPGADTTYRVTVSNVRVGGVARTFIYAVTVFDPDVATTGFTVSGAATLGAGQTGVYSFEAQPGATDYQWRSVATSAYTLADGAEAGSGNFTVATSAGYDVVAAGVAAGGANAFHLAHPQPVDQTLQLNAVLVPGAASALSFASRLGLASTAQEARVEVSLDDGASWQAAWTQAGAQSGVTSSFGETSFTTRSVSLAPWAGRSIRVRFRYAFTSGGSYYPQTSSGVGWYIDDIAISGASSVAATGVPTSVAAPGFSYTAQGAGQVLLQARAGMFGYYSDWSAARTVSVTAGSANAASDCLFNWAERNYPGLFAPAGGSSLTSAPYYYRYYAGTNIYLGVSSLDGNVYYLTGGVLQGAGPQAGWLVTAGCS